MKKEGKSDERAKKGSRQEERSQSRALNLVPQTDGIQSYTNCEKAKSGMTFFAPTKFGDIERHPFPECVKKKRVENIGKLGTDLRKAGDEETGREGGKSILAPPPPHREGEEDPAGNGEIVDIRVISLSLR